MAKVKAKKPAQQADTAPAMLPASKKDGRRTRNNERRAKLTADLAMEIDALRLALTEMMDRYRFKIEGELLQLAAAARGEAPLDGKAVRLQLAVTQKMLTSIRKTEIKPKKGRAKDFARFEDLVEDLTELLPEAK